MSNPKEIRKQIRNVAQELVKDFVSAELIAELESRFSKKIEESINSNMAAIDSHVKASLEHQDKRAKAIQGFFTREVAGNLDNRMYNMDVTMQAWQEFINEKLGAVLGTTEEINQSISERKVAIQAKIQDKAVAAQQEAIKGKSESPKADSAQVQ